ncbi:MAG TPA: ribosome maturation factor RimM [Bacteroidales bacterium]|nr:ribosome maturation factor RimM [Bacteroidales bacterium]
MNHEDCFYLGFVSKTFGYQGEVSVFLDVDDPSVYRSLESVFIELEGKLVPFFIKSISLHPNNPEAIVSFQDVCDLEKARKLTGANLYLPIQLLPKLDGNAFYFHEIIGFQAIDMAYGHLGTVTSVLEYPGNPIFQIQAGKKEVLVPANDEFIQKLDRKNKKIYLKTPEGLVDLYLKG